MNQISLKCNLAELQNFQNYVYQFGINNMPNNLGMDKLMAIVGEIIELNQQMCTTCQEQRVVVVLTTQNEHSEVVIKSCDGA